MKKIILISLVIVSIISCSKSNENNILTNSTLSNKTYIYQADTDCKSLSFCQKYYPLTFGINEVSVLSLDIKEFKPYFLDGKIIKIKMNDNWTRTLIANDDFTELIEKNKTYRIE